MRFLLPALALAAAFPASSQVLEYASDSASATVGLEALAPAAAETPVILAPAAAASPLAASPFNEARIMGVMPDYQTVRDTTHWVAPLTAKEKWLLAEKETVDPFNIATAFLTAAESQAGNETPKYGEGWANYGRRVGAAQLDFATQNYFSAGVLANVLHQDPRYFRRGPQSKILPRVFYSISRLVVARQDSGRQAFNASGIGGMVLGIAASNLYYPAASVSGSVMFGRVWTSLMGGAVGNLMSEFWPDLQQKFFPHHGK
jgi:hypothetical protein